MKHVSQQRKGRKKEGCQREKVRKASIGSEDEEKIEVALSEFCFMAIEDVDDKSI